MSFPDFFTKASAAEKLGVSQRTIDRMVQDGLPIHRRIARGKVLIDARDLQNFLIREQRATDTGLNLIQEALAKLAGNTPAARRQSNNKKALTHATAEGFSSKGTERDVPQYITS